MIRVILAFLASVLTGVQTYLIYSQKQAFCFNSGCEIVESLTVVPPLYFNLAGFLFFQVIFWCLLWGRNGSEFWNKFAQILLTAGLVAEAVLVFFQYSIAQAFCSYCLVVCSCILLLNIFCGLRQMFRGFIFAAAVLVACFSLQFNVGGNGAQPLEAGSIASVNGEAGRPELYLFFSATCPHCEAVIEVLKEENVCGMHFNPIESLASFTFPAAELHLKYDPSVNLGFLKSLSIKEVPVLVSVGAMGTQVIEGKTRILSYLGEQCRPDVAIDYSNEDNSFSTIDYTQPSSYLSIEEEGCSVEEDCEPPGKQAVLEK